MNLLRDLASFVAFEIQWLFGSYWDDFKLWRIERRLARTERKQQRDLGI